MNKTIILYLSCALAFAACQGQRAQQAPYDLDPYNAWAPQNTFLQQKPSKVSAPAYQSIKDRLPQAIWHSRPDVIACYDYTWQQAFANVNPPTANNGFVSPYIQAMFNGNIFMWDASFMTMFGQYARQIFDFQQSLDNFYAKQHKDGFMCREIRQSDGSDCFDKHEPSSTGPNIMPWAEWEYFLKFNDTARLRKVFVPLLAYYQWFRNNRTWPDGSYYTSGWGCGLDNQPRIPQGFDVSWSHAFMSWIDANLQAIFAGKLLIQMAEQTGQPKAVEDIRTEVEYLTEYVNTKMWNSKTKCYADRFRDGTLSDVKSVIAYWALLAGVADSSRANALIGHLTDTAAFNRPVRVPALSADTRGYQPDGGYWNGGVWAPTTYMTLRGLSQYRQDSLAHQIALNNLNNAVQVYTETKMLREYYTPEYHQGMGREHFVGWTGIIPINILFEYVFGLRPDVPANTLVWDLRLTDEHGVTSYPFGADGTLNLLCHQRNAPSDEPQVEIVSNTALTVELVWDGGYKTIKVNPAQSDHLTR